ncbi:hypothetical protein [Microbacterium sp. K41]|uniref:hypothetical protein n=1 Tax=Microbacterium sp. K41 TaxID=2305437 RepID=UPI00109C10C1|nr:hypothetical protein [Microbacterium sp. K41]
MLTHAVFGDFTGDDISALVEDPRRGVEERVEGTPEDVERVRAYADHVINGPRDARLLSALADPRSRDYALHRWDEALKEWFGSLEHTPSAVRSARLLADGVWLERALSDRDLPRHLRADQDHRVETLLAEVGMLDDRLEVR